MLLFGQSPTGCFLSGRIVNAANGEPVRNARLVLHRADNPAGSTGPPASFTTMADDRGIFAMKDIDPGKYRFSVQRAGFADAEYGARRPGREGITLSLDAGQRLENLVFRLTPHAVISGRITDQDGDPVDRVVVTANRYSYRMGKRQLVQAGTAMTDDLGEYRMFGLAPGRYYVSATYRGFYGYMGMAMRPTGKTADESYAPTYYPGTIEAGNASALDLAAGTQLRGVDFALIKAHTVRVRGRVSSPEGVNREFVMIMLVPRGLLTWELVRRARASDAQGNFELADVRPGTYYVTVFAGDSKNTYTARQQIEVASANIDGVMLNLSAGFELTGQVRFEGPPPPSLTELAVSLDSRESGEIRFGPMPNGHVKDDGSFTLPNTGMDVYRARIGGLPDGYYLKSVRMGDDEVRETGIDMRRGPAGPLVLTISARAGQVEGIVFDARQQGFAGATVVLVPEPKLRDRSEDFKQVTTDQYGRFILKTIEPGEYKLFAWEDVERGEYMDPEFLRPVEERGHAISIHEGSRESVELKLIPAEQPVPKPAKKPAN
jgi:hypothetical protein